ncbi:relaxase/mobilization nuclease domain-containing protein, partial [Helicobacter pullorum]
MDKTALFEELFDEYRKIKKASSIIKEKTQTRKVFNHYVNHINYNFSSKQVVAKLLSNIGGKDSFKRALEYVEKNANKDLTKNYERVENAMEYISKHSPLLDEDNNIVDINNVLKDWEKDFGNKENSKDVWHLMFSIKEISTQKNLNILKKSVNEVMRDNFFGYKYVMALHTHQNNPHIHIILNKRNIFTKKKIHFENKQEISDFWDKIREDFKYSLNSYGLKYNNYSKLEKDLNKEYQKIKSSKLHNDNEHLNDSLYKILSKEETKEDLRRKTLNDLKMEYEELRKKRFELIDLMILYKKKNNKRYFKISKEIKSINQALEKNEKISLNLIKSSNKSKKKVFYVNQILDNNRSTLIDTLQKQKNFIRLFNEKIKKGGEITISDYRLLKEVEKSIKQNN